MQSQTIYIEPDYPPNIPVIDKELDLAFNAIFYRNALDMDEWEPRMIKLTDSLCK